MRGFCLQGREEGGGTVTGPFGEMGERSSFSFCYFCYFSFVWKPKKEEKSKGIELSHY